MSAIDNFKKMLLILGIDLRSVTFDAVNKTIVADFTYQGAAEQRIIPFADVEAMFSDAPGSCEDTSRRHAE